jgi:hypothetical protein
MTCSEQIELPVLIEVPRCQAGIARGAPGLGHFGEGALARAQPDMQGIGIQWDPMRGHQVEMPVSIEVHEQGIRAPLSSFPQEPRLAIERGRLGGGTVVHRGHHGRVRPEPADDQAQQENHAQPTQPQPP